MTTPPKQYLKSRVLKTNVGFLLSAPSGTHQDSQLEIPTLVKLDEELIVNAVNGSLRMTRTKEGVLVQADLTIDVTNECSRCLTPVGQIIEVDFEDLYVYPPSSASEFSVGVDANLDLAPLLRAEVIIAMSRRILCKETCLGLCLECGANLNDAPCSSHDTVIDPRMAALKKLLAGH